MIIKLTPQLSELSRQKDFALGNLEGLDLNSGPFSNVTAFLVKISKVYQGPL